MKKYYLAIVFFTFSYVLLGQELTPNQFLSASESASNGGVQLSWAIGGLIVSDIENSSARLDNGVYPGDLRVFILEVSDAGSNIHVYPNPVKNKLTLDTPIHGSQTIKAVISNAVGHIVFDENVDASSTSIGFEELAIGPYFLRLFNDRGQQIAHYKILKN